MSDPHEREAAKWYREAAAGGNAVAVGGLGAMDTAGRGVERDGGEALIAYATPDFAFTPAQLAALTREDSNVVREFLRRFPEMEYRSRNQLTEKMVRVFRDKTGYPVSADLDWEQARAFLASLLSDLEEFRRNG